MRRVLVDADAFVALAGIGHTGLLRGTDGRVEMPAVVQVEVAGGPGAGALERAVAGDGRWLGTPGDPRPEDVELAAECLGRDESTRSFEGDVELLAPALAADDRVVVTDDATMRKACRALGVPVTGSVGVVIAAVERGDLDRTEAREALVALDEVGPRLTAGAYRRATELVDEAAGAR